jgi:hypothetical protein
MRFLLDKLPTNVALKVIIKISKMWFLYYFKFKLTKLKNLILREVIPYFNIEKIKQEFIIKMLAYK